MQLKGYQSYYRFNQDISPLLWRMERYDENGSKSRAPFHSKAAFHYIKSIVAAAAAILKSWHCCVVGTYIVLLLLHTYISPHTGMVSAQCNGLLISTWTPFNNGSLEGHYIEQFLPYSIVTVLIRWYSETQISEIYSNLTT